MNHLLRTFASAVALSALLAGCGEAADSLSPATIRLDSAGATSSLGSFLFIVPPGAVASGTVDLRVELVGSPPALPSGWVRLSSVVRLSPAEVEFSQPVTLAFSVDGASAPSGFDPGRVALARLDGTAPELLLAAAFGSGGLFAGLSRRGGTFTLVLPSP